MRQSQYEKNKTKLIFYIRKKEVLKVKVFIYRFLFLITEKRSKTL